MILKDNCKYALLTPTSMGVRITPIDRQPVHSSDTFKMQATSAESNVVTISALLGLPVKILTRFIKGSPVSQFIKNNLASRHIDFEGAEIEQGGPWGHRHQFNIADSGFGNRGPRVHNDRAGEVGLGLSIKEFKKNGTLISFDLNHRASFWEGREDELHKAFTEISELSDILVGNEEDFQLCLKLKGPEAGGKDISEKIDSFKIMIENAKKRFPNTSVFATTLREVVTANCHLWGAIISANDDWHIVNPREIGVLDRIGGGDGFVGGLLYAILKNMDPEKWIQFGWATGALAATMLTDYAQPADEEQVWSIWQGNARVRR